MTETAPYFLVRENVSAVLPMLHENPNYKRTPEKGQNQCRNLRYDYMSQPQDNCMSEPL